MKLEPNHLYHVYNQGNDRQQIFFSREDYLFFLKKVRKHILPEASVLAYCLMPNHYHFLIYTSEQSCIRVKAGNIEVQRLTSAVRVISSSYTNFINKRDGRSGSLFRQRTKFKLLTSKEQPPNLGFICFHYIHQNPLKAKIMKAMEDWEFSSFRDYAGLRSGSLCSFKLAESILGLTKEGFIEESQLIMRDDVQKLIH